MTGPTSCLIDSHCHIDIPDFDADRREVGGRVPRAGVATMLVVGGSTRAMATCWPAVWPRPLACRPRQGCIRDEARWRARRCGTSCGSGPRRATGCGRRGGAGLPLRPLGPARANARRSGPRFVWPVSWGCLDRSHSRAEDETVAILEDEGATEAGRSLHCFTAERKLARRAWPWDFPHLLLGIGGLPSSGCDSTVARTMAGRPAAGRDGRSLPGPAPETGGGTSRPSGRGGSRGRQAAGEPTRSSWGAWRPRTRAACSGSRRRRVSGLNRFLRPKR